MESRDDNPYASPTSGSTEGRPRSRGFWWQVRDLAPPLLILLGVILLFALTLLLLAEL